MQLVVILPDTVDPSMVDQLQAAVHRMGGQVQPEEQEPSEQVPAPPVEARPQVAGARANRPPMAPPPGA